MDSYQPIYDAIRSRISNCDIGHAIEQAIRDANISHYIDMAGQTWQAAASEFQRPSVLFRPNIFVDGNMWCALYGVNLQEGVCAFGKTPAEAALNFDTVWYQGAIK